MKLKIGQCIDCPPGEPKPLTAKRCHKHYWAHRRKVNEKKPAAKAKVAYKQTLSGRFDLQIRLCTNKNCENCGTPLGTATRTNIAHIVKKSIFEEVAQHPLNRWFACWQCHTNYDNWCDQNDTEKLEQMPVIEIARSRYSTFSDKILKVNKHRVPQFLET